MNDKNINKLFYNYKRRIKNVWEEYLLIKFSLDELKKNHKKKSIGSRFKRELLLEEVKWDYKDMDIHDFIESIRKNKLDSKTLIEAVSLTETFLQDLTSNVYKDFPLKVTHNNPDSVSSEIKLTKLIVSSANRDEMINALVEEKVRSIFYGKPVEFFEKDKAKIGINSYFKSQSQKALTEFTEIIATRNIIIHNNGNVDSKYLREVKNSTYSKGNKIKVDKEFIRNSIIVLRGLSATTTKLVLENTYNIDVSNKRITRMAKTLNTYLEL